ncbi:MAG: YMGG-like glycine zipper-containing protein [Thermoanaerobaculia bacterium]|jgi:hypothetical protein
MPVFECVNSACPNFVRTGVRLQPSQLLVDNQNYYRCPSCHSYVRVAQTPQKTNEGQAAAAGALIGAALGAAIGGPPGAVVGGALGLLFGSNQRGRSS